MERFTGLIGVVVLLALAVGLSLNRRAINWRLVASAVGLQFVLAFLLLKFPPVVALFDALAVGVTKVISFGDEGTRFLFGNLTDPSGPWGFVFAIRVLPIIVFFAALMSVLYHLRVMQVVVAGAAWVLRRTLGITGAEAIAAAANIFVGQTEAPLMVKPYIAGMTRSQLMAIMVPGFASIAGSVLAAYVGILGDAYGQMINCPPGEGRVLFAKHLMTASVMSAPAGLLMAKIVLPETETPRLETVHALLQDDRTTRNVVDAAAAGATDGMKLAANVAAMLVAFVALLALLNWPIQAICGRDLQTLLGYLLTPMAWAVGVSWEEAPRLGSLMGTGIVATEFIAYLSLGEQLKAGTITPRTAQIATYCLCGFANIPSIAIQIGGLSAMAPNRRSDLAALGPRAMVAGALACWMTGAIAGVFIK